MQKNHKKQKAAVLIFAKVPEVGSVKTRLSKSSSLTDLDAKKIAEAMLKDTICLADKSDADRVDIGYFPDTEEARVQMEDLVDNVVDLKSPSINFFPQKGDNFDERFGSVVKRSYDMGADGLVVLGADLPHLNPLLINRAFKFLVEGDNEKRLVLGPAGGGGIYLVGLKKDFDPEWFSEYKLFTGGIEILQFTRFCDERGNHLLLLPPLSDIDIEEDLVSLVTYIEAMKSAERYESYNFPVYTAEVIDELGIVIEEETGENRKRRIGKGKRGVLN
ncbi:MAG: DUF2064 domain-containing protein [Halobacteriota archaeon]|nr:DUF2064 domain-containing protein [Halobacteriota archaeon]